MTQGANTAVFMWGARAGRGRQLVVGALAAATLALSGCGAFDPTTSGEVGWWTSPQSEHQAEGEAPTDTIKLAAADQQVLPQDVVAVALDNHQVAITHIEIPLQPVEDTLTAPPDAVALLSPDAGDVDGAVPYGRDDVCVAVDASWFSANRKPLPKTMKQVRKDWGRALALEVEQSTSPATELWGEKFDLPRAAKEPVEYLPVRVMAKSVAAQDTTNVGGPGRWRILPKTCVKRELFLVPIGVPGPEFDQVAQVLLSPAVQEALEASGSASSL